MSWNSVLSSNLKRARACRVEKKKNPQTNNKRKLISGQKRRGICTVPEILELFACFSQWVIKEDQEWTDPDSFTAWQVAAHSFWKKPYWDVCSLLESKSWVKTTPIPLCFPQPLLVPSVGIPQEERPSGGARWRERRRNVQRTGGLACSPVVLHMFEGHCC